MSRRDRNNQQRERRGDQIRASSSSSSSSPSAKSGQSGQKMTQQQSHRQAREAAAARRQTGRILSDQLTGSTQQTQHAQDLYRQSVASNSAKAPNSSASVAPATARQQQDVQNALVAIQKIMASLNLVEQGDDLATTSKPLPNTPHGVSPLQDVMEQNSAPQLDEASMFAPGAPLRTVPQTEPATGPRQYNYPVGYNIAAQPRSSEQTSATTLRALALYYDGITLCEGIWFDIINRLEPVVSFDENVIPDGESATDPKWRAISDPALAWVKKPDGRLTFQEWLTASARDVLELGYSIIFKQRDNAGRILALDLVDAALIKPLIDERGKMPAPPFAAFQQYVWGVPGGTYRADEMLMVSETTRTDSIYPFSRVERILLRINQALRKQNRDLRMFTDGAPPAGMLVPDADAGWTPEQCEQYEQDLNDLLAGNDRMRARLKVTPPGATFVKTQPDDPQMTFDEFLLNVTAAAFGVTMDELGMTGDSNRSVGQTQENVIYRRVVAPLVMRFAMILTEVIKERFDERLVVELQGFEEKEDALMKAQTLEIGVKNGAISPSQMAREMGWPVDVEVPPMVMTATGPIWLEDALLLRQAQIDAKRAGLEFAIGAPGQAQMPDTADGTDDGSGAGSSDDDASDETSDKASDKASDDAKPATTSSAASSDKTPAESSEPVAPDQRNDDDAQKKPAASSAPAKPAKPAKPTPKSSQQRRALDLKAISAEYRRWYRVVTRAASRGEYMPTFTSAIIPAEDYALLAHDLAHTYGSLDAIKAAFARAREREREADADTDAETVDTVDDERDEPGGAKRLSSREQTPAPTPKATTQAQHALRLAALNIFDEVARTAHHAVH